MSEETEDVPQPAAGWHGKADFNHIYDQPDPREYFATLHPLEYRLSDHAQRIFGRLAALRAGVEGRPAVMLDLACSYGVNAALTKFAVSFDELAERYASAEVASLSSEELVRRDAEYFAERRLAQAPTVYGLDVAPNAVAYAVRAGILDDGAAQDLESAPAGQTVRGLAAQADLVTVSGGIGYLTERTVARVLDELPAGRRPWMGVITLRAVPMEPIAAELERRGFVLDGPAEGTLRQRRFVDEREQAEAVAQVVERGLDPTGREASGWWHATVYLARAADDERVSLDALVGDADAGLSSAAG